MSTIRRKESSQLRILVIRADRIGDVILSTPVFEALKSHFPGCHLSVMVREQVVPLLRGLPTLDEVMIYDPDGRHAGLKGWFRLRSDIRKGRFRIAVALQTQWRLGLALYFAGIRYRVGPLSKLHSFFVYNRGIRQHRSQVEMHEADYNLQLLRRLGVRVTARTLPTRIHISEDRIRDARKWLSEIGVVETEKLVAIHPGMGGSALNWPEEHFIELICQLARGGKQVLLTFGPMDQEMKARIRKKLDESPGKSGEAEFRSKVFFYEGTELPGIDGLGALFSCADLVVAPSTGPLHVAVALGKPVVTFYPPVRVMSALRWGPYTPDESHTKVLFPEVYCGQDYQCAGSLCHYFPCMKTITVSQAVEEVERRLDV